jgi:hypothetical protein
MFKTTVSAKVMRSYNYCHFEMALTTEVCHQDEAEMLRHSNDLRKDTAKLVDEAVRQYKQMKDFEASASNRQFEFDRLKKEVAIIRENFPMSEWTSEQKAKVKLLDDYEFQSRFDYVDDNGQYF